MSLSDPIGDMLARIKNALLRNHSKVKLPSSIFKSKIAEILKSEGYVIDFKILNEDKKMILEIDLKYNSGNPVISSIERVASVSLDRKEGVKLSINKDNVQLSVNSANSGEGNEKIKAEFNSDNLIISFNSKYLLDIASEVENKNLKLNLKDPTSPVLIEDLSDKNSFYVIMPMKIWF